MDLPFALEGFFFEKVNRSTGHFHFPLYYICASLMPHAAKGSFCFACSAAESNSAPFAALHLNGVCRWTSQLLLRGSFSKRSTGRRVNGSNGSTGHFHFHYIIYDSRRCQAHATPLQKAHWVNGSTGQWVLESMGPLVNGSMGQTDRRVNGSLSLYYTVNPLYLASKLHSKYISVPLI